MSREQHLEAMRVFKSLEEMDPALRQDALADESHDMYHVPCSAGLTAVIFRRLGIDVDEWDIYWQKLYQRPVARVFKLYQKAQEVKPENYNNLLTSFAKQVKPLEEA